MSRFERGLKRYDWVGRIDTGCTVIATLGAAVVGIAAYISDWSAAGVILAMLLAGAATGNAYVVATIFVDRWDAAHPKIELLAAPILVAQEGLFRAKYIQVTVHAVGDLVA